MVVEVIKYQNRANTKLCYSEAGVSLEGRVLSDSCEAENRVILISAKTKRLELIKGAVPYLSN